ncbi:28S ribosomal protein S15, mitochondrial [Copidosoma floridanum]|uniref:28S ribosomal protein S15, mitochondrial n=1 Tax=Copidosoma floridanum TaxID=29053 RepID=UPI0006C99F77|nr:28S ribosomal protein S15, mitochondrial [Copidosoma floridanum]
MNATVKTFRCLSVFIGNTVRNTLPTSTRGYAIQRKIPVTWIRPTRPTCYSKEKSGDGGLDFDVKPEDCISHLKEAKELEDADDIVKKLVSVEFNGGKSLQRRKIEKAMNMVYRHNQDRGSTEVRFARMTARILRLQNYLETEPHDKKAKNACKELIEKRQKLLKKLRERDYPCFEYILERLNLTFRPGIRPEHRYRAERKSSTKKILQNYCDELVKKKLDTYRKSLEAQQKDFFKDKAEKLEFIRNEEIACGVEPSVTEEEIEAAKQKAATFA